MNSWDEENVCLSPPDGECRCSADVFFPCLSRSTRLPQLLTHRCDLSSAVLTSERSKSSSQSCLSQNQTWSDEHVKPPLKKLYWVPAKERIIFKTATLHSISVISRTLPPYLHPACQSTLHLLVSIQVLMTNLFPVWNGSSWDLVTVVLCLGRDYS